MIRDTAYMSFDNRQSRIHIHTGALRKIGRPQLVRFRVNHEYRMMILECAQKKEPTSFWVSNSVYADSRKSSLKIYSKLFCDEIYSCMSWNPEATYRVPGMIFSEQSLVRFDLNLAVSISSRFYCNEGITALNTEENRYHRDQLVFFKGERVLIQDIDYCSDRISIQEPGGKVFELMLSAAVDYISNAAETEDLSRIAR